MIDAPSTTGSTCGHHYKPIYHSGGVGTGRGFAIEVKLIGFSVRYLYCEPEGVPLLFNKMAERDAKLKELRKVEYQRMLEAKRQRQAGETLRTLHRMGDRVHFIDDDNHRQFAEVVGITVEIEAKCGRDGTWKRPRKPPVPVIEYWLKVKGQRQLHWHNEADVHPLIPS